MRGEPLTVGISLGGVFLRRLNSFKNMESLMDEDARSDCNIIAKTGTAKATFGQLWNILVDQLSNIY